MGEVGFWKTEMIDKYPILIDESCVLFELEFPGNPIAHERPRQGKHGHFYIPEKTKKYRENLAWAIKSKIAGLKHIEDLSLHYGVQALFYRSTRQRIDLDNLMKTVFDAITSTHFWSDDSMVHEMAGRIIKPSENPKTDFIVYKYKASKRIELAKNYVFLENCHYCGGSMNEAKSKSYPSSQRKYCSKECFDKSCRDKLNCARCGKEFEIPKSFNRRNRHPNGGWRPRRFCSRKCSIEYHQNLRRIKGKESDKWICTKCGGRVSRKEYKVCRACSMLTRSDPTSNYWKLRHLHKSLHPRLEINIIKINKGGTS